MAQPLEPQRRGDGAPAGVVTRFAPSPTGYLHLGHALCALINFDRARAAGGRFVLRIEDIDLTRCRPDFDVALREDLAWLGLAWEEPLLRQSERLPLYAEALDDLKARGLVYRCFRNRQDMDAMMGAPHGLSAPAGPGAAMSPAAEAELLASGQSYAWRLSMAAARQALGPAFEALSLIEETPLGVVESPAHAQRFGDVVLGRKDIGTSYHLASVIDDAAQGVTHVIRGEDLRDSAGLHRLLQALLGLPRPVYAHHRLVTNEQGQRLAKRDQALALRAWRQKGKTPGDVRRHLGLSSA